MLQANDRDSGCEYRFVKDRCFRGLLACLVASGLVAASGSAQAGSYVAVTWGDDAVHLLDQDLQDTASFSTSVGLPNGVATAGNLIWVGSFTSQNVFAYNFTGAEQFQWSLPSAFELQALDYAGSGQLLAMDAVNAALVRFDAFSGAVLSSIPAISASTEAIAIDGGEVWQLTDDNIYLTSLVDGAIIRTIPNAARLESFEGTAMANNGDSLVLGSDSGNWYRVSKLDGAILDSGNNGLEMFDLQPVRSATVPDTGSITLLFAIANLGLVAFRKCSRKPC